MPSIFSRIVAGEIPSYRVAETEEYLAFLDIRPMKRGHTLVIPKKEVDYVFDLEEETLSGLMVFAKKVAKAIEAVVPCERIGIAVVGLEVPHAHVHLLPLDSVGDLSFAKEPVALTPDEFKALADAIGKAVKA